MERSAWSSGDSSAPTKLQTHRSPPVLPFPHWYTDRVGAKASSTVIICNISTICDNSHLQFDNICRLNTSYEIRPSLFIQGKLINEHALQKPYQIKWTHDSICFLSKTHKNFDYGCDRPRGACEAKFIACWYWQAADRWDKKNNIHRNTGKEAITRWKQNHGWSFILLRNTLSLWLQVCVILSMRL